MSKDYLLENREEILAACNKEARRFQKSALLTKKEK